MTEFSIELAAERINDSRIRGYFQEVLSSFIIGNYRSAMVMLWSVIVCDLVFKLQDLRDIYNDSTASAILEKVKKMQDENSTSPTWEHTLLDEVKNRTKLLDSAAFVMLEEIQKYRHLSAHPVIQDYNILFKPTPEIVRASIRSALESLLLKPALFSRGIVNEFVRDMEEKKQVLPDIESQRNYIQAKYFRSMTPEIASELFRSLWKFTFNLENEDTDPNRDINYRALLILYKQWSSEIQNLIRENSDFFSVVTLGSPMKYLVYFLYQHAPVYTYLNGAARELIKRGIQSDPSLLATGWFVNESVAQHLDSLVSWFDSISKVDDAREVAWGWHHLKLAAEMEGVKSKFLESSIQIYVNSKTYDLADIYSEYLILPFLNEMDESQMSSLINGIENNDQLCDRRKAYVDHARILSHASSVFSSDYPLQATYPKFVASATPRHGREFY